MRAPLRRFVHRGMSGTSIALLAGQLRWAALQSDEVFWMFSKHMMFVAVISAALLTGPAPADAQSSNEGRRPPAADTRGSQRPESNERPSLRRRPPPKQTPARPDSRQPERKPQSEDRRGNPR